MDLFSTPDSPRGLAAGTLVTTPDGDKKIEEIKAGDLVLSGVGESYTRYREVGTATKKFYNGTILKVTTDSQNEFRVIPNYICFAFSKSDKPSKESVEVRIFERLEKVDRTPMHFVDGDRIIGLDQAEEYAHKASFYKGGAQIERFADFRFSKSFRFMPALNLRVGMQIPVIENELVESATISNITEEQYDGLIYNLDIPETRNFAANGVLVHDSRS